MSNAVSHAVVRRGGRKRAAGERTPSGQLSRRLTEEIGGSHPAAVMRLVRESLRGCADPAYGAPLGRLFLDGKISSVEFEAGKRWDRLIRRYHFAIAAPLPDPRTVSLALLEAPAASPPPDPDSTVGREQVAMDREATEAFRAAHSLMLTHGVRAERETRRLCEGAGEFPCGAEALARVRSVLASLAKFWRLTR